MTENEKKIVCSIIYDFNVSMLFSGAFDNITGKEIKDLTEKILNKYGVYEDYIKLIENNNGNKNPQEINV